MSNYTEYRSIYSYVFFVCNRFHLIKNCLSCLVDMHLYSNNLSTIGPISSLIILEIFPACFSCSNNFNLSQSSLGSHDKNFVEIPEAMIAGQLSSFVGGLSLILGRPFCSK